MNVGNQPKTKEIFECFRFKIEQVFETNFTMSYNPEDDKTRIYYNSKNNRSNFNMTIFEENGVEHVPNTMIKIDKCILKINYFEVSPVRVGLGTKLFNELLLLLSNIPIKGIVVVPENEGAKLFWKKLNFNKYKNHDTQLYLDI